MWLRSIFIVEESSLNLSGYGTFFNSKERSAFFCFLFFLFAHNSTREENPKEGGQGGSVTVPLGSLTGCRPQPHQRSHTRYLTRSQAPWEFFY